MPFLAESYKGFPSQERKQPKAGRGREQTAQQGHVTALKIRLQQPFPAHCSWILLQTLAQIKKRIKKSSNLPYSPSKLRSAQLKRHKKWEKKLKVCTPFTKFEILLSLLLIITEKVKPQNHPLLSQFTSS